jgi:hypothetical protein
MKPMLLAALLSIFAATAFAQNATSCKTRATENKYAGAALNSFMTKCEKVATASCEKQAAEKNYHGAAKTSFTKKCVSTAVGG